MWLRPLIRLFRVFGGDKQQVRAWLKKIDKLEQEEAVALEPHPVRKEFLSEIRGWEKTRNLAHITRSLSTAPMAVLMSGIGVMAALQNPVAEILPYFAGLGLALLMPRRIWRWARRKSALPRDSFLTTVNSSTYLGMSSAMANMALFALPILMISPSAGLEWVFWLATSFVGVLGLGFGSFNGVMVQQLQEFWEKRTQKSDRLLPSP